MTKKIALVTGAGSGVGRAAALALLADGYIVVLTGRRQGALEETISLAAEPANALAIAADVTDPAAVEFLFAQIKSRCGRLDLLFNNAGTNVPATNFGDLTMAQWSHVVAVNLNGAFLCANAAYRMMRDQTPQGGRIINNGSISAHSPRPGSAPYTATKHAITGLTKTIALDGRAHNIACGQIDIGNAATPMTRRMATGVPQADGSLRPEPTMDVEIVGRTLVYMASLPPDANAMFLTVMATTMPFAGRG
ncbi:SDR family oxidoreductase [Acidiphilium sp.]|uniref:SDR family oxidoreductase n=1 Tax=Acidiphilium sp. TaxID=527 RepID=UPI003CFEFFE3